MSRGRRDESGSRSAEDRARAAAERAARRAAREGRPVEPPPPGGFFDQDDGPPPPIPRFEPDTDAHEPTTAAARPRPPHVPGPDDAFAIPPRPSDAPDRIRRGRRPPEPEPDAVPEHEPEPTAEDEDAEPEFAHPPAPEPDPEPRRPEPEPAAPAEPDAETVPEDPVPAAGTVRVRRIARRPDPEPFDEPTQEHVPDFVAERPEPPVARAESRERLARPTPAPDLRPVEPVGTPILSRGALIPPRRRPTSVSLNASGPRRAGRRIAALIVFLALFAVLYGMSKTFQPFKGSPGRSIAVVIPEQTSTRGVGDLLAERGVVDSGLYFTVNATLTRRKDELKPGRYVLAQDMSYGDAIDALRQGPPPARAQRTFKLSIPEGLSRREIVDRVKDAGIEGDYLRATRSTTRARRLGAPKAAPSLEGYLFPATYDLQTDDDARDLVAAQLKAFADNVAEVDFGPARKKNLTRYEVLIIASMIEREAQLDQERRLISAVIYNRLKQGIKLGIDATIRYESGNWERPLRVSELEKDTAYNTRLRPGLPPTPIGNPGLASIRAAARPANSKVLFYVVKPGTCGEHAFSETDAQFERDVARYNAEREKAGGNSPTTCPE